MLRSSCGLTTIALVGTTVNWSLIATLPEGLMKLPRSIASTPSWGERLSERRRGRGVGRGEAGGVRVGGGRPDVAGEGGRRRDARQAGEHRADLVQRHVLELADGVRLALEDEVADGQAARVEPDDVRRQRPD